MKNVCSAIRVKFFCNLIREEGKIAKKETIENEEKLKDQLFKERCSRNEIISDYEKIFYQENKGHEMWKEQVDKEIVSHN